MSLISVARNAARWLGFDLGRADGHVAQAVVVIDPATGEAGAHGLTDAQLRASAVPVSLAATPGLTDAQLRATPVPTADSLGGTRTPIRSRPRNHPQVDCVASGAGVMSYTIKFLKRSTHETI